MGLPLPLDKQRQGPQAVSNLSAFVSGPFRVCHDRGTVQLAHLPRAVLNELKRLKLRLIANFGPSLCTGFSFTTGFAMALTAALMCDQVTLYGFTPTADAPPPRSTLPCDRTALSRYAYYTERPWWASGMRHMTAASHTGATAVRKRGEQRLRHFFELEAAILHEWARHAPARIRVRAS